jgi:hypothetical protein
MTSLEIGVKPRLAGIEPRLTGIETPLVRKAET